MSSLPSLRNVQNTANQANVVAITVPLNAPSGSTIPIVPPGTFADDSSYNLPTNIPQPFLNYMSPNGLLHYDQVCFCNGGIRSNSSPPLNPATSNVGLYTADIGSNGINGCGSLTPRCYTWANPAVCPVIGNAQPYSRTQVPALLYPPASWPTPINNDGTNIQPLSVWNQACFYPLSSFQGKLSGGSNAAANLRALMEGLGTNFTNVTGVDSVRKAARAFCSQLSTNCPNIPTAGRTVENCSMFVDTTAEGQVCREWFNIDKIGASEVVNTHCGAITFDGKHPPECLALYPSDNANYNSVVKAIGSSGTLSSTAPGCWFKPLYDMSSGTNLTL